MAKLQRQFGSTLYVSVLNLQIAAKKPPADRAVLNWCRRHMIVFGTCRAVALRAIAILTFATYLLWWGRQWTCARSQRFRFSTDMIMVQVNSRSNWGHLKELARKLSTVGQFLCIIMISGKYTSKFCSSDMAVLMTRQRSLRSLSLCPEVLRRPNCPVAPNQDILGFLFWRWLPRTQGS